jgi:SAM-dependent methyltransferase
MTSIDNELTSDYWAKARELGEDRFHWISHPITRAHINLRVSGNHEVDSLGHWQTRFLPNQVGRVLSVGCGFGHFERSLASRGIAEHVHGIDISAGAIAGAAEQAEAAGLGHLISYEVVDVNTADLGEQCYDAIFGVGSIHHIFHLEHFFAACRRALKPDGLLFMDEYIGVSKWQVSDDVLQLMNSMLERLPAKYRRVFGTDPVQVRDRMYRTDPQWFVDNDPSESVRSAEIMSQVKLHFDVVDERPYGGALLHLLLSMIAGNFDENDENDRALLEMLVLMERELERSGRVGTDFAAIVCRPKA